MSSIEAVLEELALARIGATFNPFRQTGRDDLPGAPAIRLANLRRNLSQGRTGGSS